MSDLYSDRWGIFRVAKLDDHGRVRSGWVGYIQPDGSLQVRTFDTQDEARSVMVKMVPKSRYTRRRFSFTTGLIPAKTMERIQAGTYRETVPRETGDRLTEKRDWIEDERHDARMEASEREYYRRRDGGP